MPPKRPRIEPSQTKISVQDVRDYSTPEGAAMANEEMRRIQLALEQIQQQPEQAAGAAQPLLPQPQATAVSATEYALTVANQTNANGISTVVNNVETIRFDDNKQKSTDIAVNFEVSQLSDGIAQVRGYVPSQKPGAAHNSLTFENVSYFRFLDTTTVIWTLQMQIGGNLNISAISPLQIQQSDTNVGDNLTTVLNFENLPPTKPVAYTDRLWFDVTDDGSGKRTVIAWYAGGAGSYSWFLQAGAGATEEISSGETVTFTGSGAATVTRAGNTININVPASTYNWKASDGGAADTIATGETVTWKGASGGGISVVYTAATNTFNFTNVSYWRMAPDTGLLVQVFHDDILNVQGINGVTTSSTVPFPKELVIDRPLQIQQANANVGDQGTVTLDFYNATPTLPVGYTSNIFFEITDLGSGERQIKGWYEDLTAGSYYWTATGDTGSATINNTDQLKFTGTNSVTTSVTAGTPDIVTINRPLQMQQGSTNVGLPDTKVIDFFNASPTKPAGYTKTAFFEVVDNSNGTRTITGWYEDLTGTAYSWKISANGGTSYTVANNAVVDFSSNDGTVDITRTDEDINLSRPLTIEDDNVAVGPSDTLFINFDSNGQTATNIAVNFVVTDNGAGQRSIKGYIPSGSGYYDWSASDNTTTEVITAGSTVYWVGGSNINVVYNAGTNTFTISNTYEYHFFIQANSGTTERIDSGETINFTGSGIATVTRTGNTIDVNVPSGGYSWTASDGVDNYAVGNGNTVTWQGSGAVDVDLVGSTFTVTRPLTIEDDNTAVGANDTEYINFDSNGQTSTATAVNFVISDAGAGQRNIRAYVPSPATYGWNISANGGSSAAVLDGATVDFSSVDGTVTITRSGDDINLSRPLTIEDDNVAVGNTATTFINFDSQGSTTTSQPINFQIVDDGAGQRTVRGWVPAGAGTYTWLLAASGTAGTENIDNTDTVTFIGVNGIQVTRSGSNITISIDEEDPPWSGSAEQKRRLAGELVFQAGQVDIYGTPPAYFYGVRRYVDIVHNWNLSSLNNFHLELVEKHLNDLGNFSYHRNTQTYPTAIGPLASSVRYRNLPHWAAIDRNTVRVWSTMTEEDGTDLVFRYVLTEE